MPEITKKKIRWHKVTAKRTICEVHREIHDAVMSEEYDKIIPLLEDAYLMAKKMDLKLRQYAYKYDDGWYEQQKPSLVELKKELRRVA